MLQSEDNGTNNFKYVHTLSHIKLLSLKSDNCKFKNSFNNC